MNNGDSTLQDIGNRLRKGNCNGKKRQQNQTKTKDRNDITDQNIQKQPLPSFKNKKSSIKPPTDIGFASQNKSQAFQQPHTNISIPKQNLQNGQDDVEYQKKQRPITINSDIQIKQAQISHQNNQQKAIDKRIKNVAQQANHLKSDEQSQYSQKMAKDEHGKINKRQKQIQDFKQNSPKILSVDQKMSQTAQQTDHQISNQTNSEAVGTVKKQLKMQKDMKYIEQKIIPTDQTLKYDQQNSTIIYSTSVQQPVSSAAKYDDQKDVSANGYSCFNVSEFQLKPRVTDRVLENQCENQQFNNPDIQTAFPISQELVDHEHSQFIGKQNKRTLI